MVTIELHKLSEVLEEFNNIRPPQESDAHGIGFGLKALKNEVCGTLSVTDILPRVQICKFKYGSQGEVSKTIPVQRASARCVLPGVRTVYNRTQISGRSQRNLTSKLQILCAEAYFSPKVIFVASEANRAHSHKKQGPKCSLEKK